MRRDGGTFSQILGFPAAAAGAHKMSAKADEYRLRGCRLREKCEGGERPEHKAAMGGAGNPVALYGEPSRSIVSGRG
jgi:hypothetical protein